MAEDQSFSKTMTDLKPSGLGSGIGAGAGFLVGGPAGAAVGGVVGGAAESLVDTIYNIFAKSDYEKEMEKNRQLAERIYQDQKGAEDRASAQAQKNWQASFGLQKQINEFNMGQTRYQNDVAKKQDRYNKWVTFTQNMANFMADTPAVRQNYINNLRQA